MPYNYKDLDFVHITEAGLGTNKCKEMKGYRAIKLEHKSNNRESVLYVREEYYGCIVRIQETKEAKIGSEIIHVLLETQPPTNIICEYQETGISNKEADEAHKILNYKVSVTIMLHSILW